MCVKFAKLLKREHVPFCLHLALFLYRCYKSMKLYEFKVNILSPALPINGLVNPLM